ncbi:MAG TPA: Gfo/Idh/MocA family oxidoreductase [Bryobacteraceae bacterium]|nr:Gfo/Idh/MocA family oxidoreductase [Bryobacteraceae bacterium]
MKKDPLSRRSFLKKTTAAGAAASTFTIIRPELVRGTVPPMLKVGLIGCGGRGTQAVENIMEGCPNVELVAMADMFENRLESSLRTLRDNPRNAKYASRIKVDPEHRFIGFDAYKKVIASDVDIVFLCTPPGYRPMHFEACVEAKKHVFCEKPFGTDPVGVRRFMAAAKKSEELKLTVKSGAQRRSQPYYLEQYKRVKDGEIGEITALYAYWIGTPVLQFLSPNWPGPKGKRDPRWSDMEFQNRNWYSFVWICGDQVVEQHLHNIDVCNWFMGTHPVECVASGGVAWRPREEEYGNIYDHLAADFVYPNGVHMSSYCRQYRGEGVAQNVSEIIVGTKGRIDTIKPTRGANPYVQEHVDMMASILGTGPYINEAMAVAESTMTCIMAREAAYSGRRLTWDDMMKSQLDLLPKNLDINASVPVPPLAVPGVYKFI